MARALSPNQIMKMKYHTINWNSDWQAAFTQPERTGNWFIWGNSGNGKTSFVMQLAKELAKHGRVLLNSLEEGARLTMQGHIKRHSLNTVKNLKITCEPPMMMLERLKTKRAPHFFLIDSIQYASINFSEYQKIKETYPDRLFIWISHADGKRPAGSTAMRVKYDADLKIWIEGFIAHSNGRYNPGGQYVIWEQGAKDYYGDIPVRAENFQPQLNQNA